SVSRDLYRSARSLAYGFRYFSAEFPGACDQFHDSYLALLTSAATGIPLDTGSSTPSRARPENSC
ncbi:MAG TPA: hypothetical protein VNE71_04345, partial [Myxococcota bacterium]|nr:hypothetical protein [Myxococcota bacterium]